MQNSIPKIIHYAWFGGNSKPDYLVKNIESWKKFCPDYEIMEWNEDNFPVSDFRYVKEAYESKKWAFVSDFVRLYAVYNYGGVYMDTDVELFGSIEDMLADDFFTNFENDVMLTVTVFGAKKGSSIVKSVMDFYDGQSFYKNQKKKTPDLTPNPIPVSVMFKSRYGVNLNGEKQSLVLDGERATFYPKDYFFAQDYVSRKITKTENTRGIHYFAASWQTKKQKREDRFVEGVYKFLGEKLFRKVMRKFLRLRVKKYTKIYKKRFPLLMTAVKNAEK